MLGKRIPVVGNANRRRAAAFLSTAIIVLGMGCKHPRSTPENATAASYDQLRASIGKQITIRGKFSLRGVVGPYVLLSNQQVVYVVPRGSFTWGKPYSEMEGKLVAATGTLGFFHSPDVPPEQQARARPPDYFYLEAETTQLRLVGQ